MAICPTSEITCKTGLFDHGITLIICLDIFEIGIDTALIKSRMKIGKNQRTFESPANLSGTVTREGGWNYLSHPPCCYQ